MEQESQKDAVKNNEIPEEVQLNEPTPTDEATKENEQVKDKLGEFGFDNLEQFMIKMTSDSIFARKATRKLLGLDADLPFRTDNTSGARQEHNITGTLLHTDYPPKVKAPTPDASKAGITESPLAA